MYYGPSQPPPDEHDSGGCRDVWLLTRAAFGILLVPLAILFGALFAVMAVIYLFSRSGLLGLLGVGVIAVGIYVYARWERHHFRAP
jgi:hypothetical protein